MTTFDPKLGVVVSGNEIVVVLPGSNYTVTYFKRRGSPGLLAKNIADKDDPRTRLPLSSLAKLGRSPAPKRGSLAEYRE
jgi:hypothetical protein